MNGMLERLQRVHHLPALEIAVDQLDWAIKLLIENEAYVPAYVLAGNADEILGKPLGERSALKHLKNFIDSQNAGTDLNKLKNFLKHGNEPMMQVSELSLETALMIIRAQRNLEATDNTFCSEWPQFVEWLHLKHPQLFEDPVEEIPDQVRLA